MTREIAEAYVDRLERRDWPALAELLDEDMMYEMPQTRERIRGRDRFVRFNAEYPGDWHLSIKRVVAEPGSAALLLDVRVGDAGERQDACVWLDIPDGRITRVTDYWPDPYDPPPGREHLTDRF